MHIIKSYLSIFTWQSRILALRARREIWISRYFSTIWFSIWRKRTRSRPTWPICYPRLFLHYRASLVVNFCLFMSFTTLHQRNKKGHSFPSMHWNFCSVCVTRMSHKTYPINFCDSLASIAVSFVSCSELVRILITNILRFRVRIPVSTSKFAVGVLLSASANLNSSLAQWKSSPSGQRK